MNLFKSTSSSFEEDGCQEFENKLINDFKKNGIGPQLNRDAFFWEQTLEKPGNPAIGNVLRRIFLILRYGGLMYRQERKSSKWTYWKDTNYPIATALSHGGRIMIQLPPGQEETDIPTKKAKKGFFSSLFAGVTSQIEDESHDHEFWTWLITGGTDTKELSKYVSTATSGDEAKKNGMIIFRRLGATHALTYYEMESGVECGMQCGMNDVEEDVLEDDIPMVPLTSNTTVSTTKTSNALPQAENNPAVPDNESIIPEDDQSTTRDDEIVKKKSENALGTKKYIKEIKTSGVNTRDTKFLGKQEFLLKKHRHWGMNIPLGGEGNKAAGIFQEKKITSDGTCGHMYLYYMSPAKHRYGGILIGVESSEFNKVGQSGSTHTMSAHSSTLSPTFGLKWRGKVKQNTLADYPGPDKYDSLFIDLSQGWVHLCSKPWTNDMVKQTALVPNKTT